MKNFLKGIVSGLGGVSPGLSGSVMMIIFGIYEDCIEAIGTFFKNPIKSIKFLFPLFLGIGIGVIVFGKIVAFLLENYKMYTQFAFLGLVLGALPLFYKEVKKKDFSNKHYLFILGAFLIGFLLFLNTKSLFNVAELNIMQSILLGIIYAASTIIPGVDSAVILSALGMYEIFVFSLANLDLSVLIPVALGGALGIFVFSVIMNKLIEKHYSLTYSVVFGLFISIIPSVVDSGYSFGINISTGIAFLLLIIGFIVSFKLCQIKKEEINAS